jgi:hypothetical protein
MHYYFQICYPFSSLYLMFCTTAIGHPRAIDHGRSLQGKVFTVEASDIFKDNFDVSTTQEECSCTCGEFVDTTSLLFDSSCSFGFPGNPGSPGGSNQIPISLSTGGELIQLPTRGEPIQISIFDGPLTIVDLYVTGLDGSGGSNFLTGTSALTLCPSTVTFDFAIDFFELIRSIDFDSSLLIPTDRGIFKIRLGSIAFPSRGP